MPSMPIAKASRNSLLRPPLPLCAKRHRGFAARQDQHGLAERPVPARDLARDRRMDRADLARLALDRIRQDDGLDALPFRFRRSRFQRHGGRGDDVHFVACKARIVELRRVGVGRIEMRHHSLRQLHAIGRDEAQRVGAAAGVRDRRAGGDQRRIVARNVGDDQRDDLRRIGGGGEPSALDRRDMLADRVHRRDRRAGGEQRLVDGDLVGQRQAPAGDGSSAEPPPEISAMTRSSAVRPETFSQQPLRGLRDRRHRAPDARPRSTSMRSQGAA